MVDLQSKKDFLNLTIDSPFINSTLEKFYTNSIVRKLMLVFLFKYQ